MDIPKGRIKEVSQIDGSFWHIVIKKKIWKKSIIRGNVIFQSLGSTNRNNVIIATYASFVDLWKRQPNS